MLSGMEPITRIEILRVAQHMHQRGSDTTDKALGRACHEAAELLASEARRLQESGEADLYLRPADAAGFGPGTLDVLLAAETTEPGAVCDAIEAIAGEEHGRAGAALGPGLVRYCLTGATLAALVRGLRR